MSNPYLSRGPVRDPAMLFGRMHELNEIAAFIRGAQSVSIIGPRKIGKTSLIYHLMRSTTWPLLGLGADNLFVYLDCETLGEGAHAEIFAQFAAEIAAALDERGLPPEPSLEMAQSKPTRLALEGAIRKLNQRGLRIVLILDEFERISTNPQLDLNFFNALRSIAGRYQVVFLTASARPLIDLTYSGRSQEILSSPFFNIFAQVFLGLFDAGDAQQLIREPSLRTGMQFAPETTTFLYELVGGHPFGLQVACFHAFETRGDRSETEERTTRELASHFQYIWRNLTPNEQELLRRMDGIADRTAGDTTLRVLLRDLVQKCLLTIVDGAYLYPSRAWAQFVAAQDTPQVVGKTIIVRDEPASFAAGPTQRAAGSSTIPHLGGYEVFERLGRGGMAEVYRGRHPRLDRPVAIKVLPSSLAAHADFRERFEREARAVAALRHPNIVQVYDFGDDNGMYYMVMEYIAGADLGHTLSVRGALPLAEVRSLALDIAGALDYAHGQGLVHRDVKPSNVMLQAATGGEPLRAILTDFGIAKLLTGASASTRTGMMIGTLDYMAPEQIRAAGEVDGRADIYALGVMLFQMLTGRLPFTGDNPGAIMLAHLQQPAPDPRTITPELPDYVALGVLHALAKDPAERQLTAGALAAELAR